MLCSHSTINLRDSCLKIKKGDSKLFRPNITHEEKSAIQESICHIGGRLWMYLPHSTTLRAVETKQRWTLKYDKLNKYLSEAHV